MMIYLPTIRVFTCQFEKKKKIFYIHLIFFRIFQYKFEMLIRIKTEKIEQAEQAVSLMMHLVS